MISVTLAHNSDDRPAPASDARRPDESLYDYMVRSRHEMGVRLLEALSDARANQLKAERCRGRRRLHALLLIEACFAAAAYLVLAHCELAADLETPLGAAIVGAAALAGTAALLALAKTAKRLAGRRRG